MIQNFESYAQVLRKLGNNRYPYSILVILNGADALHDQVLDKIGAKHVNARDFENFDAIIDDMLNCDKAAYIVFSNELPDNKYLRVFNEVHKVSIEPLPGFKNHKVFSNQRQVFMRKYIDNPDIVALQCNAKFAEQLSSFKPWQPWFTLFVNKETKEACQVFWDTREIVGYAKLTDTQLQEALHMQNVNDNCLMLYKRIEMPENNGFSDFIIDTIES